MKDRTGMSELFFPDQCERESSQFYFGHVPLAAVSLSGVASITLILGAAVAMTPSTSVASGVPFLATLGWCVSVESASSSVSVGRESHDELRDVLRMCMCDASSFDNSGAAPAGVTSCAKIFCSRSCLCRFTVP